MPRDTPAPPIRHQRAHGRAELGFVRHATRGTVLRHMYHAAPCRVLFPQPEPGELPQGALVNVAGGLAGGDSLAFDIRLGEGAAASLTTPAAEKLYRSLGDDSRIETRIGLEQGALLEWLPQETILFDGSRLRRSFQADLAPGAQLLAAEMLVFGRAARGERLRGGFFSDRWQLRREGRLIWTEALELSGDIAAKLDNPFTFGGAGAMASLLLAGPQAEAARDLLRELDPDIAASLLRPGLLLARFLGEPSALRAALARALPALRAACFGLPPRLPRLWTT